MRKLRKLESKMLKIMKPEAKRGMKAPGKLKDVLGLHDLDSTSERSGPTSKT